MIRFDYFRPSSLEEAFKLKRTYSGAIYVSGATDVMVRIKNRELRPPVLISLRNIPELSSIEINGGACIGALVTISDISKNPDLDRRYSVLVQAARRLGSVQIRNAATVGGNLCNCSPCADTATPLLVLEAKVRLRSPEKTREIPIRDFFKGPGEAALMGDEMLTEIKLDPPEEGTRAIFLKKGRVKMDLAVASVAVLVVWDGKRCSKVRIAAGSVAPVPLRLDRVEKLLEGSPLSKDLLTEAQKLAEESVSPITDIRSTEEYRRRIIGVYVKRSLEQLLAGNWK
ncbi:MAG: xanthine dehydrogenase family protein subunit M [Candidatus Aminicenantes bacterium]|nr:xanthine dehydrogenase family protein subunit M [Candidatus Aminicenantes bacterium]